MADDVLKPIEDAMVDLTREVGESNDKIDKLASQILNTADPAQVAALAQRIKDEVARLDSKNADATPPTDPPTDPSVA